jgi:hypothetical protein
MTADAYGKSRPISGTTEGGHGDVSEHRHITPRPVQARRPLPDRVAKRLPFEICAYERPRWDSPVSHRTPQRCGYPRYVVD